MAWQKRKCNAAIIPGLVAYGLIFILSSLYFLTLSHLHGYFLLFVHILLFVFVVATMLRTTLMDPGFYEKAKKDEYKSDDYRVFANVNLAGHDVTTKWCATCVFFRPPGTVHCSECDHCVDMFDHHCPWVLNCVAKRNYRYFFCFLLSLMVHIVWGVSVAAYFMAQTQYQDNPSRFIIAGVVAGFGTVLLLPVASLAGLHIYLISVGRTTNEQLTRRYGRDVSPFSRGFLMNWLYLFCGPQFPRLKVPKVPVKDSYEILSFSKTTDHLQVQNGMASHGDTNFKGHHNLRQNDYLDNHQSHSSTHVLVVNSKEGPSCFDTSSYISIAPFLGASVDQHSGHLDAVANHPSSHLSDGEPTSHDAVMGTISLGSASLGEDALSLTTLDQLAQANRGIASPSSMHTHTASSHVTGYLLNTGIHIPPSSMSGAIGHGGMGSGAISHMQRGTPVSMLSSTSQPSGGDMLTTSQPYQPRSVHPNQPLYTVSASLGERESFGDTASHVEALGPSIEKGSYCNLFDAESAILAPSSLDTTNKADDVHASLMEDNSELASLLEPPQAVSSPTSSSAPPPASRSRVVSPPSVDYFSEASSPPPLVNISDRRPLLYSRNYTRPSTVNAPHRPLSIHSNISRNIPDILGVAPRASIETLSGNVAGCGSPQSPDDFGERDVSI